MLRILKLSGARLRFLVVPVLLLAEGKPATQAIPTPIVPTNAALRALPSTQYLSVIRLGFSSPGDGGRATYIPSGAACSLNRGNGDEGSQVRSADGNCWLADFGESPASVKVFGAVGDGSVNDVTPLQYCLAFSVARHVACRVPAGATLAADDVVVPSGATLIGDGSRLSTIRRIDSSGTGNGVLHCNGCSNVVISDLGIDGNKNNETVASSIIYFTGYSSVTIMRASIHNAKGGNGIWLDNSSDRSMSGLSTVADALLYQNDASGILVTTVAYNLRLQNVVCNANGSYGFYAGPTNSANNHPDTLQYISIEGGQFSGNGNSGVAAQGFITGYIDGKPVFGPGVWPVSDIKIRGVTANQNGAYGIVLQSDRGLVADSIANENNTLEVDGAGILSTCFSCEISDVAANANGIKTGYGIDAGCAIGAHVRGGNISNNVVGINIGCSKDSDIRGAAILNNKAVGISATSSETNGDGFGIPGFTDDLSLTGNRIVCPTSGNPHGIQTTQGATNLEISDNYLEGCTVQNAIVTDLYSGRVRNNILRNQDLTDADYTVTAVNDMLLLPDGLAETVTLRGNNNFSHIFRFSQNSVGTGIGGVRVDSAGSGFINNDTATITGCSTNPIGVKVVADRAGHLTGLRLGSRGSGCTSPTATFTHGADQRLTIMVGAWQHIVNEISLRVDTGGSLTIPRGGNILPRGAISGVGVNSLLRFKQAAGKYIEESRNF
jgi:hypothetical protein